MKAAIYARVSTTDKDQDPENQLRELQEYCERMNYQYVEYIDHASGSSKDRPEYQRLMRDADRRRIDIVMVWSLDRFGRSLAQLIEDIDRLSNRGIDFRSHTQDLDTTTPHGKLLFHVIGAFAEFERSMISERVKAGLARAKAKGTVLGRRTVVTDYSRNRILQAAEKGLTQHEIAKEVCLSRSVVQRVLAEERIIDDEDIDL